LLPLTLRAAATPDAAPPLMAAAAYYHAARCRVIISRCHAIAAIYGAIS